MYKVVITILIVSAFAMADKKDSYYKSCVSSYSTAMNTISKLSSKKVDELAKDRCTAAKNKWTKDNGWDSMKYPIFMGCWNAMESIYDPNMEPTVRKNKTMVLASSICMKIGNR